MSDILALAASITELAAAIRGASIAAPQPAATNVAIEADVKPTSKAKAKAKAEPQPEPEPEPQYDAAAIKSQPAATSQYDAAAIKSLVYAVNEACGRPAINKLLADFGASGASTIKPEDYEAFAERANDLISGDQGALD